MKVLGGAVNGWKISGYTTFQEGSPIQPAEGGNLNTTYASGLTVPTVGNPSLPDNSIKLPNPGAGSPHQSLRRRLVRFQRVQRYARIPALFL